MALDKTRSARILLILATPVCLLAQSAGSTRRSSAKSRTQTIHDGEPSTNHPGGNPGRTTGRTGSQSPFAKNPPVSRPQPANPNQYLCPDNNPVPTQILTYSVVRRGGSFTVGPLSLDSPPSSWSDHVLCTLQIITRAPTGSQLLKEIDAEVNRLQSAGRHEDAVLTIQPLNPGDPAPHRRVGAGGIRDLLKSHPRSLHGYQGTPTRPKNAQGLPDFTADGIVGPQVDRLRIAWYGATRGTGVGGTIFFDAGVFPLSGPWGTQSTKADVALVHELIHALRHLRGVADRTPIFLPNSTTQADKTWLNVDGREVIDGPGPVTENRYRADIGIAPRRCVAPTCF